MRKPFHPFTVFLKCSCEFQEMNAHEETRHGFSFALSVRDDRPVRHDNHQAEKQAGF